MRKARRQSNVFRQQYNIHKALQSKQAEVQGAVKKKTTQKNTLGAEMATLTVIKY